MAPHGCYSVKPECVVEYNAIAADVFGSKPDAVINDLCVGARTSLFIRSSLGIVLGFFRMHINIHINAHSRRIFTHTHTHTHHIR